MDNYVTDLQNELNETLKRIAIIGDTLDKINLNVSDSKIEVGSKVLVKFGDDESIEGRVLIDKGNGVFGVNRVGYAGTINLGVNKFGLIEHTLQNLSVGTYGILEKELWLLTNKITEIKKKIDEAIHLRVDEIKKSFSKGALSQEDSEKVIKSVEFISWYNKTCSGFTVQPIETLPIPLVCGIAKEFIFQATENTIYSTLIKDKI